MASEFGEFISISASDPCMTSQYGSENEVFGSFETSFSLERGDGELGHLANRDVRVQEQNLQAPVLNLPVELLVEIFTFHSAYFGLSITPHGVFAPTLTTAHTCSLWRQVAFSTPILWTNITVDLAHKSHLGVDLVKLYIRQSSHAPLTLRVQALRYDSTGREGYSDEDEVGQAGWEIFRSLIDEHARWYRVSVKLRWAFFGQRYRIDLSTSGQNNFPCLEALEIGWEPSYWPRKTTNWLFDLFHEAPRLYTLSLPHYDTAFPFPVHQLTAVSLSDDDGWITTPRMLEMCSIIEKFSLVCGPERIWTTPNLDVTSVTLKSLTLFMKDFIPACETLSTLTLPSLTTLHLTTPDPGTETFSVARSSRTDWKRRHWFRNFTDMLQRSSCSLLSLTIDGNIFLKKQLLELFVITPTLAHLCIRTLAWYQAVITDDLFQALCLHWANDDTGSGGTAMNLLPNLTSVEICFSDNDPISPYEFAKPDSILSMIESRRFSLLSASTSSMGTGDSSFIQLETFTFSAEFDTEWGAEWARSFVPEVDPRVRELQKIGVLKIDVKVNV